MNINGKMLKKIRNEMGMNQVKFAEVLHIEQRTLSRLENNERGMSIWEFVNFMEMLGMSSSDFWMLYLDTEEYEGYRLYKKVRRFLDQDRMEESKLLLSDLEKSSIAKNEFVKQSISHMRIIVDNYYDREAGEEVDLEETLRNLYGLLKIDDFDESKLMTRPLNLTELNILNHIAAVYFFMNNNSRAIEVLQALYERRGLFQITEEDNVKSWPLIVTNLSSFLIAEARYDESLELLNEALEFCRESEEMWLIPDVLLNMAKVYKLLEEDVDVYKPLLVRAYHCAHAIGRNLLTEEIRDVALSFGIEVE